jgi:KDO2-lipid IV(A) lauroyltransferase
MAAPGMPPDAAREGAAMSAKRVVDYLVYVVVRIVICVVQAMRVESGAAGARGLAWLFCDVLRIRGKVVDENLRRAFPDCSPQERHRLAQRMWEHLFLMVLEIAHTPRKIHHTNWRDFVELEKADVLIRLMLEDRPTLVTTAHLGNFEVAGYVLGILGFPTFTIARALDNRYLDRFVNRFRGATGQFIIPKNGGYDQMLHVLSHGGVMTFLADQYAGPKGCWVEFFGQPASAHKAIALLALEHQAPVVATSALRTGEPLHFRLSTHAVADPRHGGENCGSVRSLTQWYTKCLEEMIRMAPDQYWWLHRRWKDTRSPRKARKQAA